MGVRTYLDTLGYRLCHEQQQCRMRAFSLLGQNRVGRRDIRALTYLSCHSEGTRRCFFPFFFTIFQELPDCKTASDIGEVPCYFSRRDPSHRHTHDYFASRELTKTRFLLTFLDQGVLVFDPTVWTAQQQQQQRRICSPQTLSSVYAQYFTESVGKDYQTMPSLC